MDTQPSLCQHPYMDDTVWYEVPCGMPMDYPEPIRQDNVYDRRMMLRAWCPVCQVWKEPLLALDGAHYLGDELS